MTRKTEDGYRTVRIKIATHVRLQKIVERVARDGWKSIGSKRTTAPTLTDIVEEAVDRLDEKGR